MVWIVADGDAQRLDFAAISDSTIVSGLVYLALRVYSGRSAAEILATEPDYIADIGLAKHLSPTRSNGLAALLGFIRTPPGRRVSGATRRPHRRCAAAASWCCWPYRIFAILSYQIVAVTVGWHVFQLTRDPLALRPGRPGGSRPVLLRAPFAGYLVDHLPRRKLGMVSCLGLGDRPRRS